MQIPRLFLYCCSLKRGSFFTAIICYGRSTSTGLEDRQIALFKRCCMCLFLVQFADVRPSCA